MDLKGVRVTPDLVGGDGYPRHHRLPRRHRLHLQRQGRDAPSHIQVGQPIASLDVIRNGASGNAIAVGVDGGLMIFDSAGAQLWTTTSEEWSEDEQRQLHGAR